MICHRTLRSREQHAGFDDYETDGTSCIGSRCALWVPEILAGKLVGPRVMGSRNARLGVDNNYNEIVESGKPSGNGWCADNLRAQPWPDPAAPVAGGE